MVGLVAGVGVTTILELHNSRGIPAETEELPSPGVNHSKRHRYKDAKTIARPRRYTSDVMLPKEIHTMRCAECAVRACSSREFEKAPDFCPMEWEDGPAEAIREKLTDPALRNIALNAARVEAAGYCRWTRVEETMEFASRCGFRKLGLAFCNGLREEARVLNEIFRSNGFDVCSVACKCGGVQKEEMGILDSEKVRPGNDEVMCNPIGQAQVLERLGTDFNVVVGLCVGHDTLFLMHTKAPATVLIAKDRVLAHNPAGAVYLARGYYKNKLSSHPVDGQG